MTGLDIAAARRRMLALSPYLHPARGRGTESPASSLSDSPAFRRGGLLRPDGRAPCV